MTTPNEREAREPMFGAMLEADFEKNTVTFEMCGEYYAAAGLYEIRPHVAALTREQREGETETQRAIIEAAEQRGYERGKAEWRQQVKDAWNNLSVEKVDKPKDTGRFA